MKLNLLAVSAELFDLKFGAFFRGKLHVNLVPLCNIILVFTDGTD